MKSPTPENAQVSNASYRTCLPVSAGIDEDTGSSPPTRKRRSKTLRLYIAATDLSEYGPRRRGACAIVYLRESSAMLAQMSSATTSSDDGLSPSSSNASGEARIHVGQTEIARLSGRDVEFVRTFTIPYETPCAQVVHIDMYGCECRDPSRNWLLGVAEVPLVQLYSARGFRTMVPIAYVPTEAEKERKRRGDCGVLHLVVEDITAGLDEYRLDIQCTQMKRAKPWSCGVVKRAHYTIHMIASSDEQCDDWVLLFRSDSVEMVKKKRDGGSLEYNYFSSRPLKAAPGIIVAADTDDDGSNSVLHKTVQKLKNRHSGGQFFSLPSGCISSVSPNRRLKLSIYDDSSLISAPDFIADTQFTISDLRNMDLRDSTEVQVNSNPVGKAELKFVECASEPKYFCLSLSMPHLR